MKNILRITNYLAMAGCLTAFLAGPTLASVVDAPHNETNHIDCGDCHTYSVWWQYSPEAPGSASYGQVTDAVCANCHGLSGPAFTKLSHSATTMGDAHPVAGNWSTNCIDCHDPHIQKQIGWMPASPVFNDGSLADGLYLVEGTMDTIINNGDNTTTFNFTSALAKDGWTDPLGWDSKSGNDGRGLIVTLNYGVSDKSYEVVSAMEVTAIPTILPANGSGSITVQSGSDPIDSVAYEGSQFGLIYGQLLKKSITTPNSGVKTVKLLDAKDGLVDGVNSPPQGVCQVCHTMTSFYLTDGTAMDTHYTGTCTYCHAIAEGFKPSYSDHDTFVARITAQIACGSCHDTTTYPDLVRDIHDMQCGFCHDGAPPPLKIASFRTTPTSWPTGSSPPNQGDCGECHGDDYFLNHEKATDHTGQVVAATANCTDACHFHKGKDVITGIHGGADTDPATTACYRCHDIAGGGELISLAATHGPGDCTHCHVDIANDVMAHPNDSDHTGQVEHDPVGGYYDAGRGVQRVDCATCHTGNPVWQVHYTYSCSTCHGQQYFEMKGSAATGTPGSCSNCHTDPKYDIGGTTGVGH